MSRTTLAIVMALLAACAPATARAEPAAPLRPYPITENRAACAAFDPLKRPFFGDTHVHTAHSFDASTQDTRNQPRDAYRFARGEAMGIQPYGPDGAATRTIQLSRPLDFAAVTDHSEMLGEIDICTTPGAAGHDSVLCWIHEKFPEQSFKVLATRSLILRKRWGICDEATKNCEGAAARVWQSIQDAAEEAYDRSADCRFTSFVGYEWTAVFEDGINFHRNVIFRNQLVPKLPASWIETPTASDLWDRLQRDCVDGLPGCDAITIPHNSNLSAGLMFESARIDGPGDAGTAVTATEARRRQRWEPLVEIMQHKGDSECYFDANATDEACAFEYLEYDRFGPKFSALARRRPPAASNFVRSALLKGLAERSEIGTNSLKFGIVASTDTHIAAPGFTSESNARGHGGAGIGAADGVPEGFPDDLEFNPGGLAVLWSEENSRDALFAAMQRREAYGTSGTRPIVRFFGGWDYPDDLCGSDEFARAGYDGGVPMGGDLPPRPGDAAPRFALWAVQDPGTADEPGTPLERMQIVKGWIENGETREKVVDVAVSGSEAGVDLATCERTGGGRTSVCSVWSDPDFDPEAPAFYYARILEDPSCRWSQYICNAASVDCADPGSVPEGLQGCCSEAHRPIIQERAWTSPIWYTP